MYTLRYVFCTLKFFPEMTFKKEIIKNTCTFLCYQLKNFHTKQTQSMYEYVHKKTPFT